MKAKVFLITGILFIFSAAATVFSSYHHMGEEDSAQFLQIYPDKAKTKLDSCALCHSAGRYEKRPGIFISMGSCQYCHYRYGYDERGNIKDTLNPYGLDYLNHGRSPDAVRAIDSKDSDGDGYSNRTEIAAVRFPGNKKDDPAKRTAPYRIYTRKQLEALPQHTQFLLMNSSKSGDFYAEYQGVAMETILKDAGVTENATGIRVFSPDGWSQYHPLEPDPEPELYHVWGTYPSASYQYHIQADKSNGGWCDYNPPSCSWRRNNDPIKVQGGLKLMLAYKRDNDNLTTGVLGRDNRLDGAGPYRVIVPQKIPNPPDQESTSPEQDVIWPYNKDWDHNAGAATRTATIIKVEPLPKGTTDIDLLEAGWRFVEQEKLIIYGAIKGNH